jgi:hypothetical protein
MHIHRLLQTTPWPNVHFSSIRLWDTGTAWSDLEPRKGEWYFDRLDRLVNLAAEHDAQVLLCFGKTPMWTSSIRPANPQDRSFESGAPLSLDDWREFVLKVANRYKGRIGAYEVWNEPSYHQFYRGDVHTMVEMTRIASQAIHSVDPEALVVSPSPTTVDGLPWLHSFLDAGGGNLVDVIGYHFYVTPGAPEEIVSLAARVKLEMAGHHVSLPIWNTETGWSKPKTFASNDEASAYVSRALLLAWVSGISRFYWYAWDNRNWVTLNMTEGNDYRPNATAQAYDRFESWLIGHRVESCSQHADRTWVCHLIRAGADSYIVWNPDVKVRIPLPSSSHGKEPWLLTDLRGYTWRPKPDDAYADPQPRLLEQHDE